MRKMVRTCILLLPILLAVTSFVSCKKATKLTPVETATAAEEEQITRITDATAPATHVWKQPTTAIKIEATPTFSTPSSADTELIELGKGLYGKRGCAKCHGDNAEGMQGKGAKLAGTALTEDEFKDVLRTGGKGRLGNEHIFGTSVVSESGIKAIYAFLRSLGDGAQ